MSVTATAIGFLKMMCAEAAVAPVQELIESQRQADEEQQQLEDEALLHVSWT